MLLVRIGPYEVLGELGRGGMGVVYRVRARDGRDVALKLLLKADTATFARFERERRLLATLGEREGFVGLLEAGVSPEGAWLVMPFIPGGTLRRRLDGGPLGVEETVALGRKLATALGWAHDRGIVHRDVKPENVLFTASGEPLLADLGLARHFDRSAPGASQSLSQTAHGTIKGTAGYMAPEQLENAKAAGPPADVFALGAVLYECLAGRPAFRGESVLELLASVSSGVLEPLGREVVPAWLERVIARALARDPAARFPRGADLARALEHRGAAPRAPLAPRRRARLMALAAGTGFGGVLLAGILALAGRPGREAEVGARAPARPPAPAPHGQPRVPQDEPSLSAAQLGARAASKFRAGDRDGAIRDASRSIELDPAIADSWQVRGVVRGETGDWDGEIADETRAIELAPRSANAWAERGVARGFKGDLDGLLADESRAIELEPGLARAWQTRGAARGERGDTDGALADEARAIELDPGLAEAWRLRGLQRGLKGDWDGEIADETRAIELAPGLVGAWTNRGNARCWKQDWAGAIADETKAIELDPGRADAWRNRGSARLYGGDVKGAIADLERSLELGSADADTANVRLLLAEARKRLP